MNNPCFYVKVNVMEEKNYLTNSLKKNDKELKPCKFKIPNTVVRTTNAKKLLGKIISK